MQKEMYISEGKDGYPEKRLRNVYDFNYSTNNALSWFIRIAFIALVVGLVIVTIQ